jgi:Protein of unknown function (DUF2794)
LGVIVARSNECVIGKAHFRGIFTHRRRQHGYRLLLPGRRGGAIIELSRTRRRPGMTFGIGDTDPSQSFRGSAQARSTAAPTEVKFDHHELRRILDVYGRMVAAGEWRDYAIDFLKDRAVFSVFRRSSEMPIYRIEKDPKLARKQGAYSVISATGLILRRGHDLDRVLRVLDKKLALVAG